MFIKKYYNLFIFFALFFLKTHVTHASLTDGVLTLPKQCEKCVQLNFDLQELQKKYYEMGNNQIAVMDFGREAKQELIDLLKESIAQNTTLQSESLIASVEMTRLKNANKLLENQNNQLQKEKITLERSVDSLNLKNTVLDKDVKDQNGYLETRNKQNMSLHSTVFYYKCALSITVLLLVMSLIYPKIINKK